MRFRSACIAIGVILLSGCAAHLATRPGTLLERTGDEIMVAGQLVHTGTRVVLWVDEGGYDAYRQERRFVPLRPDGRGAAEDPPLGQRYNIRADALTDDEIERVRGGGWDLPTLRRVVDQFVIHYDVCGDSQTCFRVLHDDRHLSVHFLLDLDGTIYQTLDVKERAWHATTSNSRSVGVEIANIGAYADPAASALAIYERDDRGRRRIMLPAHRAATIRTPDFVARPTRDDAVVGQIQGTVLHQYDLTDEQYDALIRLTAALCTVLPEIRCDYPRDEAGNLVPRKLDDDVLAAYTGLLGHYHVQTNKVDPGPAFDWDRVVDGARRLMRE